MATANLRTLIKAPICAQAIRDVPVQAQISEMREITNQGIRGRNLVVRASCRALCIPKWYTYNIILTYLSESCMPITPNADKWPLFTSCVESRSGSWCLAYYLGRQSD